MSNALGAFRALKPERSLSSHNYRLSAYERTENDLFSTPAELGTGLAGARLRWSAPSPPQGSRATRGK
jgi:hypothetical protein